ncbi:MAG: YggS family pyridoxal phosphate-dependent enzyme [Candidatus Marinimicrobia bacterium]|nr:YggS family pyridoxal phosphate-dependent enzyme [Candidatus Neomarinimicrobiota bacterium]
MWRSFGGINISLINKRRLKEIQKRVSISAETTNRSAQDITIIAVTKTFPVAAMESAISAQLNCLGESRVQETEEKIPSLQNRELVEIHLIGHLQSNKVRKAIESYDVIQTVDSIKLAKKISTIANEIGKVQRIYLQVNSGNDPLKHGFSTDEIINVALEISQLHNLQVEGIMMIPPHLEMNEEYRSIYARTKKIRDKIISAGISSCKNLSMGMSRDFEMAIEEGATHIRIGTALFGARP